MSANPIALVTGNWSAANPGNTVSSNSVDPNLKDDTTDEIIIGMDREIGAGFAVGANYVWRRYGNFSWNDRPGITSADFVATTFTPTGASCPGADGQRISAATCPTITYYQPAFQNPTILFETNIDGFNRVYNGLELTGRKRLSNRWLMNTSFAYNSTVVNYGSFAGSQPSITSATISEDPTNRGQRDGAQYDYQTSGSGIGNVYVNAKWLFKLSGMYQAPAGINVSAFYNARQGFPSRGLGADAEPRERRRAGRCAAEHGGRCAPAELSERRSPRRASGPGVERAVRAVARYLQPHERQHDSGDSQPSERGEREPDSGDSGAARDPLRFAVQLVNSSFADRGRGRRPRPFFCVILYS